MTFSALHIAFNAALAVFIVAVAIAWGGRKANLMPSLRQRVEPYVRKPDARSVLLHQGSSTTKTDAVVMFLRRLIGPGVRVTMDVLARVYGGSEATTRRLQRAGRNKSLDQYRGEQVVAAMCGGLLGIAFAGLMVVTRGIPAVAAIAIAVIGVMAGSAYTDWSLSREITEREAKMLREFPTIAELLALSVAAGEAPLGAMQRITRMCSGEVINEFNRVLADVNAGQRLSDALNDLAHRCELAAVNRFARTIAVALERGTPLAEVFRAQAQDVREEQKRDLLETAGKKEILMLMPVVFLILPIVIIFAIYPGLSAINISI